MLLTMVPLWMTAWMWWQFDASAHVMQNLWCRARSDEELIVDLLECEDVVDVLLSVLNGAILWRLSSQRSFESTLLLVLAYVNQACMLHSCDLVSFYVCLEGQNFCFLVLSGLQNRGSSVESCLKYLVLSAF